METHKKVSGAHYDNESLRAVKKQYMALVKVLAIQQDDQKVAKGEQQYCVIY